MNTVCFIRSTIAAVVLTACSASPSGAVGSGARPQTTQPTPISASTPAPTAAAATGLPITTPETAARRYKGIEQGVTEEGFPYLGNLEATLTITDYSSFL